MKHIAENPFDPQKKKGEPDNGTRIKRPIEATCKPLAESSFESGSLSEMLLLQCFDGISIPVTSTSVFSGVTNFLSAKTDKTGTVESTLTAEQDETETG